MRFADWWRKKITELNILYLREFSRHGLQPAVSPADGHLATPTVDNYAQKNVQRERMCGERMKGNIVRSESRNKGTVSVLVQLKHTSKVTHIQSDMVVCNMAKQMQSPVLCDTETHEISTTV